MNELKLVEIINAFGKNWLTIADLRKILAVRESSIYTVVSRLIKKGVLIKLGQGIYGVFGRTVEPEEVAVQLYYPSYVSLKTVLSRAGVVDQIPLETQLVTTRKSKIIRLAGTRLVYRQIKPELFFGWRLIEGVPMADLEKALVDLAYFAVLGKAYLNGEELDRRKLDLKKVNRYAKKFPKKVKAAIDAALK